MDQDCQRRSKHARTNDIHVGNKTRIIGLYEGSEPPECLYCFTSEKSISKHSTVQRYRGPWCRVYDSPL